MQGIRFKAGKLKKCDVIRYIHVSGVGDGRRKIRPQNFSMNFDGYFLLISHCLKVWTWRM